MIMKNKPRINKKLEAFFAQLYKLTKIRQTPWAVSHSIPPCAVTRALRCDEMSAKTAMLFQVATNEQVMAIDLLYPE